MKQLLQLVLLLSICSPPLAAEPVDRKHVIVKLADGVFAFLWQDPVNSPEPNVLIIINENDVVVVDAELFPSSTRTVVREIRRLTSKPVRYVINTHWHDDHVFGNMVYREAWPGVEFIAHANTRTDAATLAFGAIPNDIRESTANLEQIREIVRTGKNPDGSPGSEAGLARLRNYMIPELTMYLQEMPSVRTVLPDLTFTDSLVLHRGSRTIAIRHLGLGNTRGDVVVYLPEEKILATGDLVVWPTPYGILSYYDEWAATLDRLAQFDARTVFLSHGVLQHDYAYVHQVRDLLRDLVARVAEAVSRGASLEEVQRSVTLDDWKQKFAGDDVVRQRSFTSYFIQPAVARAYHQVKGEPDPAEGGS